MIYQSIAASIKIAVKVILPLSIGRLSFSQLDVVIEEVTKIHNFNIAFSVKKNSRCNL